MARMKDKNLFLVYFDGDNYQEQQEIKKIKANLHNDKRRFYRKSNVKTKTYLNMVDLTIDWVNVKERNVNRIKKDNKIYGELFIGAEQFEPKLAESVGKLAQEVYPNGIYHHEQQSWYWLTSKDGGRYYKIKKMEYNRVYWDSRNGVELFNGKSKVETAVIGLLREKLTTEEAPDRISILNIQLQELSKLDNMWGELERKRNEGQ